LKVTNDEKLAKILSLTNNLIRRLDRIEHDDNVRADAEDAAHRARLARKSREALAVTEAAVADFRTRADAALAEYGGAYVSPPPVLGESEYDYRRRVLAMIQNRLPPSNPLYKLDIGQVRGDALGVLEKQIIEAAIAFADDPSSVPPGEHRKRERVDAHSGTHTTEFIGQHSYVHDFATPGRRVTRIVSPRDGRVLYGPDVPKLGLN
jgi:hypothetical protein